MTLDTTRVAAFTTAFPDDDACRAFFLHARWPDGFRCPRCESPDATVLSRRRLWQCRRCDLQTSLTSGTVLHGTKLSLRVWLFGMWAMCHGDDSISAAALRREACVGAYRSAWTLLQKVRRALHGVTDVTAVDLDRVEVVVARLGAQALAKASATTAAGEDAWVTAAVATRHAGGPAAVAARVGLGEARAREVVPTQPRDGVGVAVHVGPRSRGFLAGLIGWLQRTFTGVARRYAWAYVQERAFGARLVDAPQARLGALVHRAARQRPAPAWLLGVRPLAA